MKGLALELVLAETEEKRRKEGREASEERKYEPT